MDLKIQLFFSTEPVIDAKSEIEFKTTRFHKINTRRLANSLS